MKTTRLLVIFSSIVLFCLTGLLNSSFAQNNQSRTVVILSLDGFRWDYPAKTSTPNLDRLAREGVKAESLIPSFPSKTFPNHYTIATGLVPDHHGLVNNAFYDAESDKSYSMNKSSSRFNSDFYGGEPIWITAQNQGVVTASFFWVGTDVAIQGRHPDYWKPYDESIPFIHRIDTIIHWLSLPAAIRPKLIMAYYQEPDGVGHDFGPDDMRTLDTIHLLDSLTGILYDRIRRLPDGQNVNFIVVSDHGMGQISSERNIVLRDYIPAEWPVRIEGGNPNFNLYAKGYWIDSTYNILKKVNGLTVWKPGEVPEYLQYGSNARVGNLILVADSAWSLTLKTPKKSFSGGTHGYDINNMDMHTIFYAAGPAFKENFVQPSFQNIHIYPLLAHLLGIVPAKTDGDLFKVSGMLKP